MTSRMPKSRWVMVFAALLVVALVAFLFGRHDAGRGAQAQQDPPQYESEESAPIAGSSGSDLDAIHEAEFVSPEDGWALTGSRLAWTSDGGSSWSEITPPDIEPRAILATRFDGSGEGVVIASKSINTSPVPLEIFRTSDRGKTWSASDLEAEGPGSIGTIRVSEAEDSWWLLVDEAGYSSTGQRLYKSENAAKTWQEATVRPPASGPFVFFSAHEGWIVGGGQGTGSAQEVYRTLDAGATWEEVQIPLPVVKDAGSTADSAVGQQVEYGLPERSPGGILLPVTVNSPSGGSDVLLYVASRDGSWSEVASTKVGSLAASTELSITFASPAELLIQEPGSRSASGPPNVIRVSAVSDGAGAEPKSFSTTSTGPAVGLPESLPFRFLDRSHGTAVLPGMCGISDCSGESELFVTRDGGRSWSEVPTEP